MIRLEVCPYARRAMQRYKRALIGTIGLTIGVACAATAIAEVKVSDFGKTADGTPVKQYTLTNSQGAVVKLISRGATLTEWHAAFREGRVRKTYDVLVYGRWPRRLRTVDLSLARYALKSGERRVRVAAEGQAARTDFEIRTPGSHGTWLRCHPHTGRTHQIRVHCGASGHAVVGDSKYASDEELAFSKALGVKRLCLHASSVALIDANGRRRRFDAPIPDDFEAAWRALSA